MHVGSRPWGRMGERWRSTKRTVGRWPFGLPTAPNMRSRSLRRNFQRTNDLAKRLKPPAPGRAVKSGREPRALRRLPLTARPAPPMTLRLALLPGRPAMRPRPPTWPPTPAMPPPTPPRPSPTLLRLPYVLKSALSRSAPVAAASSGPQDWTSLAIPQKEKPLTGSGLEAQSRCLPRSILSRSWKRP
jgi:hypothetical protein